MKNSLLLALMLFFTGLIGRPVFAQEKMTFKCDDKIRNVNAILVLSSGTDTRKIEGEIKLESPNLPETYTGTVAVEHAWRGWYDGEGQITRNGRVAVGIVLEGELSDGFRLDISGFTQPVNWFFGIVLNCVLDDSLEDEF